MNHHIEIRSRLRFLSILLTLIENLPFLCLNIEGVDILQITSLFWYIPSINIHLSTNRNSRVRVYLWNIDVRLDLGPLIVRDVVGKDEVIAVYWRFLAPEEVNSRSVYDSTMGF